MVDPKEEMKPVDLASTGGKFKETGTLGIEALANVINEAYATELKWPAVAPLYNRMWRSDPEITIMRNLLSAWSSALTVGVRIPEFVGGKELDPPTDDDKKAHDFLWEVVEDIEGGISKWMTSCMSRVPFYGYGWWEAPLGVRNLDWSPPDQDSWRSNFDDGLIGYRRLAFRRYKSFYGWDIDEKTGRLFGFEQLDVPNEPINIPLEKSLHITFGDSDNPEGLATMEALWRLERIKTGQEFIQGVGFEHSAGHLSVFIEEGKFDAEAIKTAARNIMTAQEGNYAAWPEGTRGEIIDSTFSAAEALMNAIRYFSLLKLSLLGFQFVGIASISGTGSFAAMSDASSIAITVFNSMAAGFVGQADQQIAKRLFQYPINQAAFPNMTRRPELMVDKLEKELNLGEFASFIQAIATLLPLGDNDFIALRKRSDILPETLPLEEDIVSTPEDHKPEEKTPEKSITSEGEPEKPDGGDEPTDTETELVFRPFVPSDGEVPIDVTSEAVITDKDINRAVRSFNKWAKENNPSIYGLLNVKVINKPEDGL